VASFIDMQNRIADELDRSDLTTQIKQAINSAVSFYARKNFFGTETSFTFNTVNGQEYYTESDAPQIATSPFIDELNVNINTGRIQMSRQTFEYIDSISFLPTATGQPYLWAYRSKKIRFYPIPSQVYVVTVQNTPRLGLLTDPNESNFWTDEDSGAECLIRTKAKLYLLLNVIRASDMIPEIQMLKQQEIEERSALFGETGSRKSVGVMTPVAF
jgi:hypothetical protein